MRFFSFKNLKEQVKSTFRKNNNNNKKYIIPTSRPVPQPPMKPSAPPMNLSAQIILHLN